VPISRRIDDDPTIIYTFLAGVSGTMNSGRITSERLPRNCAAHGVNSSMGHRSRKWCLRQRASHG
jgi:hypothetical protein